MKKRQILCIDLKSFYATVECAKRNLDPFVTPLVVADELRGKGSIVLAVSPYMKSIGTKSRCRIYELPKIPIIFAKPRMKTYIDYAVKVLDIYLRFVSEEDMFIYSIDEVFLDVTAYLKYYNKTAEEIALTILKTIETELKIYATCGIGQNMLMAKFALDIESKTKDNNIAIWDKKDIEEKLWPLKELTKMWGIGRRLNIHLRQLGIKSIYDLAHYDIKKLQKHFGIIGIELYNHANGRDKSLIQDQKKIQNVNKSYSLGQVLFQDYKVNDAKLIIKEMVEDLSKRLRMNKKVCGIVKVGISYSKEIGGGFSRQLRLEKDTSSSSIIYKNMIEIFNKYVEKLPIRKIYVSVTRLTTAKYHQINLFEDYQSQQIEEMLDMAIDQIKDNYGKNSINRATSLFEKSTKRQRATLIGGHNA